MNARKDFTRKKSRKPVAKIRHHVPAQPVFPVKCDDIRPLLFDYMTHELGEAQSVLVGEHLRRCEICRTEAAEIQNTIATLQAHDPARRAAQHLSAGRHRRLMRAVMHPVADWMLEHHWLTALLTALLILGSILLFLTFWNLNQPTETPIWIRVWQKTP